MILKDFSFALRNLRRNKLLATINVVGLSIGISACLVIFLIVNYETSFDKFQPDKDSIYRVYTSFSGVFTGTNHGVATAAAVAMRDKFTGLDAVTGFHTFHASVQVPESTVGKKDFGFYSKIILAGPDYFEVFRYYQWVVGNPTQSLTEPFKVVITQDRARTYFGDLDPYAVVGKEIHYNDSLVVTVSGIVKDVRERTDLDFTDFISFNTIERSWLKEGIQLNSWGTASSSQVFILLARGTTIGKIEPQILKLSETYKQVNENKFVTTLRLQPLADLHFNNDLGIFDSTRSVTPKSTLKVLILVAVLLLIIASINFINLETAQASRHAKEVGVRKILGSSRSRLVARFLTESFILCCLSVIFSVAFISAVWEYFSEYIPQGLFFDITDPDILIFLLACLIGVTLLAGWYPAIVLSSHQPALALKNLAHANSATTRSAFIRKTLTVFQFSFSQILIIGTVAMGLQLKYMLNKDLGFESDAVVIVNTPWTEKEEKASLFRNALEEIPEVEASTTGQMPISRSRATRVLEFEKAGEVVRNNVHLKYVDTTYLRVYGIELIAGRNLFPKDSIDEYLINEKLMHALGFTDPRDVLGKVVSLDKELTIVGVVKDFHIQSLRTEIPPTAICYRASSRGFGIKLAISHGKVGDLKAPLEKIEAAWKKIYPDEKFGVQFYSDDIKRYYETEQRTGKLARAATGIAILISCLGLFGLSSFTVIQRTKEIGIRKVLGASVNSIMFLLSKDFLILVVMAFILSTPIAYYVANLWLEKFAYRMDLTGWIFTASGLLSIIIAFGTISFRTVSAAKSDPVKSLRYE